MVSFPLQAAVPAALPSAIPTFIFLGLIAALSFLVGNLWNKREKRKNPVGIRRHPFVSGMLVMAFVLNLVLVFLSLTQVPITWMSVASALTSALVVVSVYLMFKWKRLGFYLVALVGVISFVINFINNGSASAFAILLIPVAWFLFLQIKCNDGKSFWSHLR